MTIIAELYPLIIYTVLTVIIISGLLLAARFLGSGGSSANKIYLMNPALSPPVPPADPSRSLFTSSPSFSSSLIWNRLLSSPGRLLCSNVAVQAT